MALTNTLHSTSHRWRYLVLGGKFSLDALTQGMLIAFGVLFPSLIHRLNTDNGTLGFIMSMELTVYFVACPLANLLCRWIQPRSLCLIGSLGAGASIIGSAFAMSPLWFGVTLFLTGLFTSPLNQISHVVLHQYYGNRYGYANSLCLLGSLVGGLVFPIITSRLLEGFGTEGALLCLGGVYLNCVPVAITMKAPRNFHRVSSDAGTSSNHDYVPPEDDQWFATNNPEDGNDGIENCLGGDNLSPVEGNKTLLSRNFCQRAFHLIWVNLGVKAVAQEWSFSVLFLPSKLMLQIAFVGWSLFVVSYAISRNVQEPIAARLPMAGAVGGFVIQGIVTVALHYRHRWCAALFIMSVVCLGMALLIYPTCASMMSLLVCSFCAGGGIFGGFASSYAVLQAYVSKENFAGLLSFKLFATGVGIVFSGYFTGKLYDVTGSLGYVFRILGGMCLLSAILTLVLVIVKKQRVSGLRSSSSDKDV